MKRFEYKFADTEITLGELNKLGSEGWEAIAIYDHCIFMKRELDNIPDAR